MLESFLVAGRQELTDPAGLTYGQSITDACMDIDITASVLATLAAAVRQRRLTRPAPVRAGAAKPPLVTG
jgi:3-deoxy-7-phosphoheptulonate synthase